MLREILKWAASLATGAAFVALSHISGAIGTGPSVDPLIATAIAGAMAKLVNWLISKIPA